MSLETISEVGAIPKQVSQDVIAVVHHKAEEPDEILEGLQEHYGADVIVEGYDARLRKDYFGPASRKVRCGGMLLVSAAVRSRDGTEIHHHEIDDDHRPFSEPLITKLGGLAERNWQHNQWIRDYPTDPRAKDGAD